MYKQGIVISSSSDISEKAICQFHFTFYMQSSIQYLLLRTLLNVILGKIKCSAIYLYEVLFLLVFVSLILI